MRSLLVFSSCRLTELWLYQIPVIFQKYVASQRLPAELASQIGYAHGSSPPKPPKAPKERKRNRKSVSQGAPSAGPSGSSTLAPAAVPAAGPTPTAISPPPEPVASTSQIPSTSTSTTDPTPTSTPTIKIKLKRNPFTPSDIDQIVDHLASLPEFIPEKFQETVCLDLEALNSTHTKTSYASFLKDNTGGNGRKLENVVAEKRSQIRRKRRKLELKGKKYFESDEEVKEEDARQIDRMVRPKINEGKIKISLGGKNKKDGKVGESSGNGKVEEEVDGKSSRKKRKT